MLLYRKDREDNSWGIDKWISYDSHVYGMLHNYAFGLPAFMQFDVDRSTGTPYLLPYIKAGDYIFYDGLDTIQSVSDVANPEQFFNSFINKFTKYT